MQLIERDPFFAWTAERGIVTDARPAEFWSLDFSPGPLHRVCWPVPHPPSGIMPFLSRLFSLVAPDAYCVVSRAGAGYWYVRDSVPVPRQPSLALDRWLAGCGVPSGQRGALRCERSEFDLVLSLVMSALVFTWGEAAETYVIPDHGRCLVQTDLKGHVWVSFRNADMVGPLVRSLEEAGYPLAEVAENSHWRAAEEAWP